MHEAGSNRRVEYVMVHFQPFPNHRAVREMDTLLGLSAERITDVRCQLGHGKVLEKRTAEVAAQQQ